MASILYELAKHPQHIEKLRQELAPFIRGSKLEATQGDLAHAEHLNAVINETLRLHPPVPTTLYRLTPREGIMIGNVHVPGGACVMCPQYAVGRSKSSFNPCDLAICCPMTAAYHFWRRRSRLFESQLVHSRALVPIS